MSRALLGTYDLPSAADEPSKPIVGNVQGTEDILRRHVNSVSHADAAQNAT